MVLKKIFNTSYADHRAIIMIAAELLWNKQEYKSNEYIETK